jgi:hypothetical protein
MKCTISRLTLEFGLRRFSEWFAKTDRYKGWRLCLAVGRARLFFAYNDTFAWTRRGRAAAAVAEQRAAQEISDAFSDRAPIDRRTNRGFLYGNSEQDCFAQLPRVLAARVTEAERANLWTTAFPTENGWALVWDCRRA